MPGLPAPLWTEEDARGIVHAPHWYDLFLIATNTFSPWIALDGQTGKLLLGQQSIRKAFARHFGAVKAEAAERLGGVPTLLGEFGISFDMQDKKALRTGNFSGEIAALDRTFQALDANLLSGTIWNYTPDNTNGAKDRWNAQDYSIFSRGQQAHPTDVDSGGRALEVAVRPYAAKTAGEPLRMSFDVRSRVFQFEFRHDPAVTAPTEIFVPDYQYPKGCRVDVSDGECRWDTEAQTLLYWHGGAREVHQIQLRPAGAARGGKIRS
jgi:hypothetical protein